MKSLIARFFFYITEIPKVNSCYFSSLMRFSMAVVTECPCAFRSEYMKKILDYASNHNGNFLVSLYLPFSLFSVLRNFAVTDAS